LYNFFSQLFVRILSVLALLSLAANWLLAYRFNTNFADYKEKLAILHYNVNFGVDLIDKSSQIFIIPLTGTFFLLLNAALIIFLFNKNRFFVYALFVLAIASNLILLAGEAAIYYFNFR